MSNDKFPSIAHVSFSPGVHDDDIVVKGKSPLFQGRVVIHEKLDGGNCCIFQGKVYARSRNQVAKQPWFGPIKVLVNSFPPDLYYDNFAELQLFGENMVAIHSISYSNLTSPFYLFGVYDPTADVWFSVSEVEAVARSLGLPTAPKLFEGKFEDEAEAERWCLDAMQSGSDLGGEKEGFVFRVSGRFQSATFERSIAKFVRKGHVQTGKTRDFVSKWKRADISAEYREPNPDFDTLSFLLKKTEKPRPKVATSKKKKKKEKKSSKSKKKKVSSRFIVTVGIQGSGKSTFARHLCEGNSLFTRAGRDLMGSNDAVYSHIANQLRKGGGVVVENCNVMLKQRRDLIQAADAFLSNREMPICVWFNVSLEECLARASQRSGHETGALFTKGKKGSKIIQSFYKTMQKNVPTAKEGFGEVIEVSTLEDVNRVLNRLGGTSIVLEERSENDVNLGCQQTDNMNIQILYRATGLKPENVLNIYVWGSRLWGTHRAESDYDFIIVVKGNVGLKEQHHYGQIIDVVIFDETAWAKEAEEKHLPAWTYYFPEEAIWKQTLKPAKPDPEKLKVAIGKRLQKGFKTMEKKCKSNHDLAFRKFCHNLRMLEITRVMIEEGEMRQDIAIKVIEEFQYEPPHSYRTILEERFSLMCGKEQKNEQTKESESPSKSKKREKKKKKAKKTKQIQRDKPSMKREEKHCDQSNLGCLQTSEINLQYVYSKLKMNPGDILNVFLWGPRLFGTFEESSPYDFIIVTNGENGYFESQLHDENRFLIYDKARWRLEFEQKYFLCYFSHWIPPCGKWKEDFPVCSLGSFTWADVFQGIELRVMKDLKIMNKKLKRKKFEQAREKYERSLRNISLADSIVSLGFMDPMMSTKSIEASLQSSHEYWESTVTSYLNTLRNSIQQNGLANATFDVQPGRVLDSVVISKEEEEVVAYLNPVVISHSNEDVMREIFTKQGLISSSGSVRCGFDVGGVIINSAARHRAEDTTFLKEHLHTPEVFGAIDTIVEVAQSIGPENTFLVSYCGPKRDAKTIEWLESHRFFERTRMPKNHLIFCRKRDHKGPICEMLKIELFVDDNLSKVLELMIPYDRVQKLLWLNLTGQKNQRKKLPHTSSNAFGAHTRKIEACRNWHDIKERLFQELQSIESSI